jgi:hypothetical protein
MKITKIYGTRATRVPPLHSDPVRTREIKSTVARREYRERNPEEYNFATGKMEVDATIVKLEAMYPRMNQAGDFNSSRRSTERIFRNGKDVTGRRVEQGSIERPPVGQILPKQRNEAAKYKGIRRIAGR